MSSMSSQVVAFLKELEPGSQFTSKEIMGHLGLTSSGAVSGTVSRLVSNGTVRQLHKVGTAITYETLPPLQEYNHRAKRPGKNAGGAVGRKILKGVRREVLPHVKSMKSIQGPLLQAAAYFDNPLASFTTLELQREILRRMENVNEHH